MTRGHPGFGGRSRGAGGGRSATGGRTERPVRTYWRQGAPVGGPERLTTGPGSRPVRHAGLEVRAPPVDSATSSVSFQPVELDVRRALRPAAGCSWAARRLPGPRRGAPGPTRAAGSSMSRLGAAVRLSPGFCVRERTFRLNDFCRVVPPTSPRCGRRLTLPAIPPEGAGTGGVPRTRSPLHPLCLRGAGGVSTGSEAGARDGAGFHGRRSHWQWQTSPRRVGGPGLRALCRHAVPAFAKHIRPQTVCTGQEPDVPG